MIRSKTGRSGSAGVALPDIKDKSSGKDAASSSDAKAGTKTVAELEEELEEQQKELETRDDFLYGVQRNYEALAKMCNKNIQEINDLRQELEDARNRLLDLEAEEKKFLEGREQLHKLVVENHELRQQHTEDQEQNKQLSQKCYDYQNHIADLNDIKEELSSQLTRVQGLAQTRKDELGELKEQLDNSDHQSRMEVMMAQNQQLEYQLKESLQDIEAHKQEQKRLTIQMQKLNNQLKRVEMDKENYQADVGRMRSSHNASRGQMAELRRQIEEQKLRNETLMVDTHNLQEQLKMVNQHGPELEEKLSFSEKARRTLQEQFDNVWKEKLAKDEDLKNAKDQIAHLKIQLDEQITGRKQDKELMSKTVMANSKGKNDLVQANYDLTAKVTQLHADQKEFALRLQKLTTKNQSLRKDKQFMQERIQGLEEEIKQIKGEGNSNGIGRDLDLEDARQKIKDLEEALHENNKQLSEFRQQEKILSDKAEKAEQELLETERKFQSQKEGYHQRMKEDFAARSSSFQQQILALNEQLRAEQRKTAELLASDRPKAIDQQLLRKQQKELRATVAKLTVSEEAAEASFTCIQCLNLYDNVVTCIPCGHSFCKACVESKGHCSQCGPSVQISFYHNELLADLTAKYLFRKQTLSSLKSITASLS